MSGARWRRWTLSNGDREMNGRPATLIGIVIVGFSDEEIVPDHGRDIVGVEIPVMMVADESWRQDLHDEDPGTRINFEGARCQA